MSHSTALLLLWNGSRTFAFEPLFEGIQQKPIQVDKSFFSSGRKHQISRLLCGYKEDDTDSNDYQIPNWSMKATIDAIRRVWGVGIYLSKFQKRFVRVKDGMSRILMSVNIDNVSQVIVAWTDQFKSYNALIKKYCIHSTVN